MVEVFKTNVSNQAEADALLSLFQNNWRCYKVNIDLDDCDKVLRVESASETIDAKALISFLALYDFIIQELE